MANNPWKNMFLPHIWQRGVDYYRDGRVLDLHYRSSEVTAQVEGGETLTFRTGVEQDMDDSDGGLSILASFCMDAWSQILEQADLEGQREILHWFTAHYTSLDLGRMFLDEYLYAFRQDDLVYVLKLKAMLTPEEWAAERDRLLNSTTMRSQVYSLLEQEQMYEALMQTIEKNTDIYALERYERLLKKSYGQRCLNVYVTHLQDAMGRAYNRKAYWSVIQTLKKVRKYPDGKVAAKGLADCWRAKYPKRTSMLDELNKAGF